MTDLHVEYSPHYVSIFKSDAWCVVRIFRHSFLGLFCENLAFTLSTFISIYVKLKKQRCSKLQMGYLVMFSTFNSFNQAALIFCCPDAAETSNFVGIASGFKRCLILLRRISFFKSVPDPLRINITYPCVIHDWIRHAEKN